MRVLWIVRLVGFGTCILFLLSSYYLYFHISSAEKGIEASKKEFTTTTTAAICNTNTATNSTKPVTQSTSTVVMSFNESEFKKGILIFLHIQKTSGKYFLLKVLSQVKNGQLKCYKQAKNVINSESSNWVGQFICPLNEHLLQSNRTKMYNYSSLPPMWLYSERTYAWPCGIHAFYTQLKKCVPALYVNKYGNQFLHRQYQYFTVLRHPVVRYINEYTQYKLGKADWGVVTGLKGNKCSINIMSEETVPECYKGFYHQLPWKHLTLAEFVSCPYNWANNRQTWMLADLEEVFCSEPNVTMSKKELEMKLLSSAKGNLKSMAFFGLAEYLKESAMLFEFQFNVKLRSEVHEKPLETQHYGLLLHDIVTSNRTLYNKIVQLNNLDMELYQYALDLFSERVTYIGIKIDRNKLDCKIKSFNQLLI